MLYIITALKPEAQAFIDKYKLKKERLHRYTLHTNENMKLIVSGLGVLDAMLATQALINQYDINDTDIFLNIGICGADSRFKIGQLLEISSIYYKDAMYTLNENSKENIVCLDHEASQNDYEIVDMESYGFYEATKHSSAIKNIFMLKVVSDHFEPKKVTKEATKSLIFNVLEEVLKKVYT
ncbi:hypothetical protein KKG72_10410 [bacterium]|nr:hypothetical protein [bacterium]MBU1994462.1 hypothetical protein [bacterium]